MQFGVASLFAPRITVARADTKQADAESNSVWVANYPEQNVWAYADRCSVLPGETCAVMISTGPSVAHIDGHLELYRAAEGGPRAEKPIWRSTQLTISQHPVGATAASVGPAWPAAIPRLDTKGWAPGVYTADFVFPNPRFRDRDLFQFVIRNPHPRGDILVKLGTNTYQAYNKWGGHSFYLGTQAGGAIVSFDRPCPPALFEYDIFLMVFLNAYARKRGITVDYITDFDLHSEPDLAGRYRLFVTSAHDEYWTKEMFDAVEHRIFRQGGNVIFYGANTAYWQVRFADVNRPPDDADRGRQIVCYKSEYDPVITRTSEPSLYMTARFRDDARRPETMLVGVGYQNWFPPYEGGMRKYPYYVRSVDGPLFAGTGWQAGQEIGDIVGYEWDNRDPAGDGHRLFDPARSHIALLPSDALQVLFEGHPIDVNGQEGRAEAVMFRSPAGARVFSTGSIRWVWGLGKPGFETAGFHRFNENLLDAMLGK